MMEEAKGATKIWRRKEPFMVINYKCPSCGAPMLFNPETQKLSCDYCGTTLSVEEYKKQFGDPEKRE